MCQTIKRRRFSPEKLAASRLALASAALASRWRWRAAYPRGCSFCREDTRRRWRAPPAGERSPAPPIRQIPIVHHIWRGPLASSHKDIWHYGSAILPPRHKDIWQRHTWGHVACHMAPVGGGGPPLMPRVVVRRERPEEYPPRTQGNALAKCPCRGIRFVRHRRRGIPACPTPGGKSPPARRSSRGIVAGRGVGVFPRGRMRHSGHVPAGDPPVDEYSPDTGWGHTPASTGLFRIRSHYFAGIFHG